MKELELTAPEVRLCLKTIRALPEQVSVKALAKRMSVESKLSEELKRLKEEDKC